jgi:hypothetical protein
MSRGIISECEIAKLNNSEDIEDIGPIDDILQVPPSFAYDVLEGLHVLKGIFASSVVGKALIIHEEYIKLYKALEENYQDRAVVATAIQGLVCTKLMFTSNADIYSILREEQLHILPSATPSREAAPDSSSSRRSVSFIFLGLQSSVNHSLTSGY